MMLTCGGRSCVGVLLIYCGKLWLKVVDLLQPIACWSVADMLRQVVCWSVADLLR